MEKKIGINIIKLEKALKLAFVLVGFSMAFVLPFEQLNRFAPFCMLVLFIIFSGYTYCTIKDPKISKFTLVIAVSIGLVCAISSLFVGIFGLIYFWF